MTKEEVIKRLKENPLDRERWIEAGKVMGWEKDSKIMQRDDYKGLGRDGTPGFEIVLWEIGGWLYQWHRLIDAMADEKSVEEFFEELK